MPSAQKSILYQLLVLEPIWIGLLALPILLPGKVLPLSYHPWLIVALFLFWPLRWFAHMMTGPHRPWSQRLFSPLAAPTSLALLVMLLWIPVNLWASVDKTVSWIAAGYLLLGVVLYVALVNWPPARRHPKFVAWGLIALGFGLTIAMSPLTAWKPRFRLFYLPLYDWLQSHSIEVGETIHANILAGALILILPLSVALTLAKQYPAGDRVAAPRSNRSYVTMATVLRLLFAAVSLFMLAVVILTQSRGAYVATVVGVSVVLLFRWPRLAWPLSLLVLVSILTVWRLGTATLLEELSRDGSVGGWEGRLEIWAASLYAVSDFPFTGIGLGTFVQVIPLLYPLRVSIDGYPHAHNLLLQVGVDLGMIGLLAYLAILANLFLMSVLVLVWLRSPAQHTVQGANTAHRSGQTPSFWAQSCAAETHRSIMSGTLGGLIALLVHGLFDAATWGVKTAFVSWILFALITITFLRVQEGN